MCARKSVGQKKYTTKSSSSSSVSIAKKGRYDPRNKLNELTGKQWVYFTNSVWVTGYSPTAIENVGLKYRKIHPSPKPPGLMMEIIRFFTKSNELILDPFAGVGGTMLGAALAGGNRKAIGIDLEEKYKKAYLNVCRKENLERMEYIIGDSRKVLKKSNLINHKKFDLIIADPPYSDMMQQNRTKRGNQKHPKPYSNKNYDLGNMTRSRFMQALCEIIEHAVELLKKEKYLVVFCKDFQPKGGKTNLLHCKVINGLNEIEGLEYKGMRIWHDQAMSLYPFGYPYAFVMNQIHQYILIFRKVL